MTMSSINSLATLQIAVTPQPASPKGGLVSNAASLYPTVPADVFANAKAALTAPQAQIKDAPPPQLYTPTLFHTMLDNQNGQPGAGDPSLNPIDMPQVSDPRPSINNKDGGPTPPKAPAPKPTPPPKPTPIVIQPQAYLRQYTPVRFIG